MRRAELLAALASTAPALASPLPPERPPGAPDETVQVEASLPWDRVRRLRWAGERPAAGAFAVGGGDIEDLPGAAADPARALQLVPGVQAANLRATALAVRGAAPDETLWMWDGVPLLSPRSSGFLLSRIDALYLDRIDVFAGAQPPELPGNLGATLAVSPLLAGDQRIEAVGEVGPFLARGVVGAPIGVPGAGNAAWIGARRSLLEPSLFALSSVGAPVPDALRVQDVALGARAVVAPGVRARVSGLLGEGLERAKPDGEGFTALDRTSTAVGVARIDAELGARASAFVLGGATRETQRIARSEGDTRRDARRRLTGRAGVQGRVGGALSLTAGAEIAETRLALSGDFLDPRTAPPFVAVPWGRMDPPTASEDGARRWTELAGFASARVGPERAWLEPAVRVVHRWDGAATHTAPEPRLGARLVLPGGRALMAQAARLSMMPRDPLLLVGAGAAPLAPATVDQLDLTLQGPIAGTTAARLDGWARRFRGLPVWAAPGAATELRGEGSAFGVDGRLTTRVRSLSILLGGGAQRVRRSAPVGPLAGVDVEPWWSVPVSGFVSVAWTTPGRVPFELGATALVRAGAPTIPVDPEVRDDRVVLAPRWGETSRTPPRGRVALRVARRIQLVDLVDLTAYADVIVPIGPLGSTLAGGSVDPVTGELDPPVVATTRDLPVVPWIGLRARR